MDPDIYAALPPDQKDEYMKMFPKPVLFSLPDAQTCTSEEIKSVNVGRFKPTMDIQLKESGEFEYVCMFWFEEEPKRIP